MCQHLSEIVLLLHLASSLQSMQMADMVDIPQDNTHFGLNKPLTGGSHSKYLYRNVAIYVRYLKKKFGPWDSINSWDVCSHP